MEPMLCIDFGNSYTKVAFRRESTPKTDPFEDESLSVALKDDSLTWDNFLQICVPTTVARVTEGTHTRYYYGADIRQVPLTNRTAKVYRNWKPFFFDQIDGAPTGAGGAPAAGIEPHPVRDAENPEKDYETWVKNHFANGGAASEIVTFEQWKAVLRPVQRSTTAPAGLETTQPAHRPPTNAEIDQVALGYFSWLRGFVQNCVDPTGHCSVSEIPCRITLPSFGNQNAAETRLLDILSRAGWTSARYPVVQEPYANAIGLYTEGRNKKFIAPPTVHKPHPEPDLAYPAMFGNTAFYRAMYAHAHQPRGREQAAAEPYWILTIDMGGYTNDFSMIALDVENLGFLDSTKTPPHFAIQSVPLGVLHLDDSIAKSLPAQKQLAMRQMIESLDQLALESFHRTVYGRLRTFNYPRLETAFLNNDAERRAVEKVFADFAQRVCNALDSFMTQHQYDRIVELVLTGGGYYCPPLRDAVMKHVRQRYGGRVFNVPTEQDEAVEGFAAQAFRRITPLNVRGATAIGGTSLLFDVLA